MAKLLIVDDDKAMRSLMKASLVHAHEVIETGEPEEALALALEHKPDAILLDLRMPKYSGFELCQTFSSFSSTQLIPVVIVSGEGGANTKQFCAELGAVGYFEKPVNFDELLAFLSEVLDRRRVERRSELRVRLRVGLRLRGSDRGGERFELMTSTENLGRTSFFVPVDRELVVGSVVDVSLRKDGQEVGQGRVVRRDESEMLQPRYAFRFVGTTENWLLD